MNDNPEQTILTLYVVPNCPLCAEARAWLRRHNIRYVERDVANEFGALREMYKRTRQNLVPVFAIEDKALVRPSEDELKSLVL